MEAALRSIPQLHLQSFNTSPLVSSMHIYMDIDIDVDIDIDIDIDILCEILV